MSFQRVPAGNGLKWLSDGISLILKNPAPFALMGLLLAVLAMVPLLGNIGLLVLGPALFGGIMYAAREQEAGRNADFKHLFQVFQQEGKLGPMLMLCLPAVFAAAVLAILAFVVIGGALLGAGVSNASGSSTALGLGLGFGGLVFALLAIAVMLVTYALTFFATPRVMFDAIEPMAAMKESLQACLANLGAFLVFMLVLGGLTMVVGFVLAFIPLLGMLALYTALFPIAAVGVYFGWRDAYGRRITQEFPAQPPQDLQPPDLPPQDAPPQPPAG